MQKNFPAKESSATIKSKIYRLPALSALAATGPSTLASVQAMLLEENQQDARAVMIALQWLKASGLVKLQNQRGRNLRALWMLTTKSERFVNEGMTAAQIIQYTENRAMSGVKISYMEVVHEPQS